MIKRITNRVSIKDVSERKETTKIDVLEQLVQQAMRNTNDIKKAQMDAMFELRRRTNYTVEK